MRTQIDRMQQNFIAYFRHFTTLPTAHFHATEDVTWFGNHNAPPGNFVLDVQLNEQNAAQRIGEIMADVAAYTNRIEWLLFPACQPIDLGKHLTEYGLKKSAGATWLLADLTDQAITPPMTSDDFHVELVTDSAMLREWERVSASGFEMPDAQVYHDAYANHPLHADAQTLHHIGYWRDRPVTSSTLLLAGGIAGLYDISTPPEFRGQGFGSGITWVLIEEARTHGYQCAGLMASAQGEAIYRRLGFSEQFSVPEYLWERA